MEAPAGPSNLAKANSVKRGDYFVSVQRGKVGVGKHISTGGRAPRKFVASSSSSPGSTSTDTAPPAPPPGPTLEEQLESACEIGDASAISALLLQTDVDVNEKASYPLRICAAGGHVRALTALGAHPSFIADSVALAVAAYWDQIDALQHLLADPRFLPSHDANLALEMAIERGNERAAALLLADARVDPSACYGEGLALYIAGIYGHAGIVALLLADARVDPSAKDQVALNVACEAGRLDVVRLLLADARVDPSVDACAPVKDALRSGNAELLELLLADSRVDVRAVAGRLLAYAVRCGSVLMLRRLLEIPGVSPSAHRNVALRKALYVGNEEIIALLLSHERLDLGVPGSMAAIVEVICRAPTPALALAVLRHPSLPQSESEGLLRRAALQATIYNSRDIASALTEAAAASPALQATMALQAAIWKGDEAAALALLSGGLADPTADDCEALVLACAQDCTPVIDALLALPAVDPMAQGGQALLRAVGGGHLSATQRLLACPRADPSANDNAAYRHVINQWGAEPIQAALMADPRVASVAARMGGEAGMRQWEREGGGEREQDYVYSGDE